MISNSWDDVLKSQYDEEYFVEMQKILDNEYANDTIYPPRGEVFNAFKLTPFENVKVVILGQDPYHNFGQSHGLAFSVLQGVKIPPSLRNIFKELKSDLNIDMPVDVGDLTKWAKQGVLLLNTVLTVRENVPNSHKDIGWQRFTDHVISSISQNKSGVIFVLWGNNAKSKEKLIDKSKHHIISCVHPSPLSASRGFFGSKPFSCINNILKEDSIDWQL